MTTSELTLATWRLHLATWLLHAKRADIDAAARAEARRNAARCWRAVRRLSR
jgi:hypothetical protein